MNRKDYLGQPIEEGATVVMLDPQYKRLRTGTVIGFTPKKVRCEFLENKYTATKIQDAKQLLVLTDEQKALVGIKVLSGKHKG